MDRTFSLNPTTLIQRIGVISGQEEDATFMETWFLVAERTPPPGEMSLNAVAL